MGFAICIFSFRRHNLITVVLFTLELSTETTQALNLPDLSLRFRGKCLTVLKLICGRQALLPRSLQIPMCYNLSDAPLYRGEFADVWKGEHQSLHVAVKVLRVYSTNNIGKIKRVSWQTLAMAR